MQFSFGAKAITEDDLNKQFDNTYTGGCRYCCPGLSKTKMALIRNCTLLALQQHWTRLGLRIVKIFSTCHMKLSGSTVCGVCMVCVLVLFYQPTHPFCRSSFRALGDGNIAHTLHYQ